MTYRLLRLEAALHQPSNAGEEEPAMSQKIGCRFRNAAKDSCNRSLWVNNSRAGHWLARQLCSQ
jgi:hypothetical protein